MYHSIRYHVHNTSRMSTWDLESRRDSTQWCRKPAWHAVRDAQLRNLATSPNIAGLAKGFHNSPSLLNYCNGKDILHYHWALRGQNVGPSSYCTDSEPLAGWSLLHNRDKILEYNRPRTHLQPGRWWWGKRELPPIDTPTTRSRKERSRSGCWLKLLLRVVVGTRADSGPAFALQFIQPSQMRSEEDLVFRELTLQSAYQWHSPIPVLR